ncbi:sensor histidine kinase [Nocardioides pinisoli]|uniref:histidine kinase n=1 Tax=Nocardioides pinisoli TaxID=2950279 RepID=A0ABT1L1D6_9ACTN|nr:PAS domain S-box protein [Nocardioides pinisoli]MCP3423838.1 PAS domain S-box protein [Nocardioides pinisoli]
MDEGAGPETTTSRDDGTAGHPAAPRDRLLVAAMQTSPDAFVVLDHEDRVEWWNRAAERLFGWSVDEAAGQLLTDLVVPEQYKEAHHEGLRRRAAGGTAHLGADPVQVEALCRDGSRILVELSVGELEWQGGPHFHAFIRDVTDRETARSALELSEKRARTAFENAPVGMLLTEVGDGEFGAVISANPVAVDMLGWSLDELRSMSCNDITHPHDAHLDAEMVPRLLSGEVDKLQYEKRFVRSDGRPLWVDFSASVVVDVDGSSMHSIHHLVDITERLADAQQLVRLNRELRQANDELAAANAELDRFAAAVAHDLKSPLMAILMHADLMAESYGPEDVPRGAVAISRAARRLNSLIEGLLLYSRAESAELQREWVDLGVMVDDVAEELAVAADRPARVTHDGLPSLRVEAVLFRQVVSNLVGNSLKYVAPGVAPHVHVTAEQDAATRAWTLHFTDNGIGIPPSSRERVFEVFHREATDYPGSGIGLATCRRIVERHGGRIWIEDANDGGSVVSVLLP